VSISGIHFNEHFYFDLLCQSQIYKTVHREVHSVQHYVKMLVSYLRQIGGFFPVSSTKKNDCNDISKILLKVALNTITLTLTNNNFVCKRVTPGHAKWVKFIKILFIFHGIYLLVFLCSHFSWWRKPEKTHRSVASN
jgi:hypothetical protein